MPHGRTTRRQAHRFVIRLWTLRAAHLGLVLIGVAAASKLPLVPAFGVCLVVVLSMWHLQRYQKLNIGLASLHALQSRRRRSANRHG